LAREKGYRGTLWWLWRSDSASQHCRPVQSSEISISGVAEHAIEQIRIRKMGGPSGLF
jgi:hypothetical protein